MSSIIRFDFLEVCDKPAEIPNLTSVFLVSNLSIYSVTTVLSNLTWLITQSHRARCYKSNQNWKWFAKNERLLNYPIADFTLEPNRVPRYLNDDALISPLKLRAGTWNTSSNLQAHDFCTQSNLNQHEETVEHNRRFYTVEPKPTTVNSF